MDQKSPKNIHEIPNTELSFITAAENDLTF